MRFAWEKYEQQENQVYSLNQWIDMDMETYIRLWKRKRKKIIGRVSVDLLCYEILLGDN